MAAKWQAAQSGVYVPYAIDGLEVETMNGTCFKGKFKDVEIVFLHKYNAELLVVYYTA